MSSGLLLLLSLAIIWGSSFWLIKIALTGFNPDTLALLRISVAGYCLLPFTVRKIENLSQLPWSAIFFIGSLGSLVPALLFAYAQQSIPSALAGMINSLQPIFTVAIAATLFASGWRSYQVAGVITGFIGALLLVTPSDFNVGSYQALSPVLMVATAAFCYAVSTNIIRRNCGNIDPVITASLSLNIIAIPLLPFWIIQALDPSAFWYTTTTNSWCAILVLGTICTGFALVLFHQLVKITDATYASTVTYLIPLVAISIGWIDGESITNRQLVGLLTVLLGVAMVHRQSHQKHRSNT